MGGVGFREDTEIDKARARDIRRGDFTEIDGIDDLLGEGAGIGFLALGQHHRGVALVIAEAEVGGGGDVRRRGFAEGGFKRAGQARFEILEKGHVGRKR